MEHSEIKESGNRLFLYLIACAGNVAAFTCGTAIGWTSPVNPKLKGSEGNPLSVPITESQASWVGSLLSVGAALGPFVAGMFVDKIGRKKTLLSSMVPFILAFAMAAFSTNVNVFFVVRFLCGLGVGGVFTVLPMYVAEVAEDEVRGALGSLLQLFVTFGLLFSYALGPYLSITAFNIACIIAPVIFIPICVVYIPESPYYLIAVKNQKDAENSLKKLRAKSSEAVQKELLEISAIVEESIANKGSFVDIFKSKGLRKALILSVGLVVLQHFSGITAILFYTQDIFAATSSKSVANGTSTSNEKSGGGIPPEISTIIIGVVQVASSFIAPAVVDKIGKRFLLTFSAIGMGISEAILGFYFYLQSKDTNLESVFWLPVVCLIGYNITYCIGFGSLPLAVMGELFPSNIKSAASTVTASTGFLSGFILSKCFADVSALIGIAGFFWILAGFCAFAAFFVYTFLPETSGKSLQEIQDILNGDGK